MDSKPDESDCLKKSLASLKTMSIRIQFLLYAGLIHLLLLALSLQLLPDHKIIFCLAELVILCLAIWTFRLYRGFIQPLNLIADGIQSIQERDFNIRFLRIGQTDLDRLIDVYNQMMEVLRTERIQLQEQHFFLVKLIEASPTGILILDLDQRIALVNPTAERILGVAAQTLCGERLDSYKNMPLMHSIMEAESGTSSVIRLEGLRSIQVQKSAFMDRGFPHHFILLQELTEEIIRTEKQAYHRVIRMMSHELNNTVGAVNSILDSCQAALLNPPAEMDRYIKALQVAHERNDQLNRFMSNFAEVVRVPQPVKQRCRLHPLLKGVYTLFEHECARREIDWRWQLCSEEIEIDLDVQQIEQVLLNIYKNALEAVRHNGHISVITTRSPRPRLIIRDDGCGIPHDIQSQLFLPFYSTKNQGQGIGLTLTREVLLNHGFNFRLQTVENRYTDFTIDF